MSLLPNLQANKNNTLQTVLKDFEMEAFSERDKGNKFEVLMQAYLRNDNTYKALLSDVWLWNEFPMRKDLGGQDLGIDLVARTYYGDYWAIQCKFYKRNSVINKGEVDSFLSTSSRTFRDADLKTVRFSHRIWISTTNKWGPNAEETIKNQSPPVSRITLADLTASNIDWVKLKQGFAERAVLPQKTLMEHQEEALLKVCDHFKENERGKLIMACGTGKTFTSLKIAEEQTNGKGLILFLVPSIALLGQALREWTAEAVEPINAICICSDSEVGKKTKKGDDNTNDSVVNLALPASTNVENILKQFHYIKSRSHKKGMTVVFSTYQSINVIAEAQSALLKREAKEDEPLGIFDLIICDEAHRTTGVTFAGEASSSFIKVHDADFIQAKRRMYMTATPRLYSDDNKSKASEADSILCSMDDEAIYGKEMYHIGFGEAVKRELLTDYKVLILAISDASVPSSIQDILAENKEIHVDDVAKLVGCINGLSKKILGNAGLIKDSDPEPMRRAVAFCQNIIVSKSIASALPITRESHFNDLPIDKREGLVTISADHIDGSMSAPERDEKLNWLKSETDNTQECRVLTNVRCLSEGVDVPSLDAVLFLSARSSQIDIVQSVGRVMRKAEGKKYGYIIIPVVVPIGMSPEEALDNHDRYKVIWGVLNALRAHDERFDATINKIDLNKPSNNTSPNKKDNQDAGRILVGGIGGDLQNEKDTKVQFQFSFEDLEGAIYARMVEKVGKKRYWETWAKDVAIIAERHIERITHLITTQEEHKTNFVDFLAGLHKNINPYVSQAEAVEMLAQHYITKPVFEALFEGYSFVKNNPVSMSMQVMADSLDKEMAIMDTNSLTKFYESVKDRASGIKTAEGRQKVILELYDKFFKSAFPKTVEKLGIVYTPTTVVDFIIHSVDALLKKEFNRSISDENVHILEPFVGTGTFITRLLQSGLIKKQDLERKYTKELHANEILLLAYYIAAINIENVYHDLSEKDTYTPFEGIILTDTFQLGEKGENNLFPTYLKVNSDKIEAQKKAPITIIMGNPPYSVGQDDANDNAQNQKYVYLDSRVAETYVKNTNVTNKNSLYDSYIKAFRWASDRLDKENGGIIGFVTNGSWLDSNTTSGFRKVLEQEFTSIYVFNLRGNQRTSGELSRKEGGKIFGSGSRTPVALTFLVKKPKQTTGKATIQYYDIGDYLKREEKLAKIKTLQNIDNIAWQTLEPNEQADWINQRTGSFVSFIPLDEKTHNSFFNFSSNGVVTSRDAWVYNSSKASLIKNMNKMIDFYNLQVDKFILFKTNNPTTKVEDFVEKEPSKISWSSSLTPHVEKGNLIKLEKNKVLIALYRPFFKQNLYWGEKMIHRRAKFNTLFPNEKLKNIVIVSCGGISNEKFSFISSHIVDMHGYGDSQCFPLYYYEEVEKNGQMKLLDSVEIDYVRRDAVSDFILGQARACYGNMVGKEDIFYYVYGFLHSPTYRETFANDLKKMLPRLPLVDEAKDFWAFSKAGRALADLHLNYEDVAPAEIVSIQFSTRENVNYTVEKMRFGKAGKETDKTTIHYNNQITLSNIPLEAYSYVVNGKSAIEWVMERYAITTHKESQITNNPNDWADEVGKPTYILDLLLSVINVSLKTMQIVNGLPTISF